VPSVFKLVRELVGKLGLSELSAEQFPEDVAKRLRRSQLRGTVEQMRVMLLGNTLFAPFLSLQAWNLGANLLVIVWTAVIILFSWWLFFDWRKAYNTDGSAADMRRFVKQTFVNSFLWMTGMALFYPMVSGDQKAVITTVIAGAIALGTTGFSRAPPAAFTYLAVQATGNSLVALYCGLTTGASVDYLISFLTMVAGLSLFSATIERGKSSILAFKDQEKLSEKAEVVELLLRDYERQATEWLWQTDQYGQIVRAPKQVLQLIGVHPEHVKKTRLASAVDAICTNESGPDVDRLRTAFSDQTEFHNVRLSILDPESGHLRWILMKGMPQFDRGEFRGFRGIFADATATVDADRRLQFLATYDSLTNLLNRNTLQTRLSELRPDSQFGVAFAVDLDGFKQINDSYGHQIGDLLLREVATRLQWLPDDNLCIARIGGDEFFVLLTADHPIDQSHSTQIAADVCSSLSMPFQIEDFNLQISSSVGIARFPEDSRTGVDLLAQSDMALYEAKGIGGDRYAFFDKDMQDQHNNRVAVIERLKLAIQKGDIEPFYQSQHALKDGQLTGLEALARWSDDLAQSVHRRGAMGG